MTRIFALFLIVIGSLFSVGCSHPTIHIPSSGLEPFPGIDLSKLPPTDRQTIVEASEDFQAVLAGKKPVHAIFDKEADLPSDGGTTFYKGRHYRLTVNQTLFGVGEYGPLTAFGPRLELDNKIALGFNQEISSIRVYNQEQLRALLHGNGL
jgi:hypothetical protein